jgi:general secretion pathway protein K
VLWTILLLAVIASSMISTGLGEHRAVHGHTARAQTEALADAGINRAILALLEPRLDRRWPAHGSAYPVVFAGTRILVTVEDESGKIDLNAAPEALLAGLFRSVGADTQLAMTLADRIADWRDGDDLRRLNGAETDDYAAGGFAYRPRNAPLHGVEELRLVLGVTPELFRRVRPALTVWSQRGTVDLVTAPETVLLALPGMDRDRAAAHIAHRRAAAARAPSQASPPDDRIGRAFTIRAELNVDDTHHVVREAVVRLTGDPARPFWIYAWRAGD